MAETLAEPEHLTTLQLGVAEANAVSLTQLAKQELGQQTDKPCGTDDLMRKQKSCHAVVPDMRVSEVSVLEDHNDVMPAGVSNADVAGCLLEIVLVARIGTPEA